MKRCGPCRRAPLRSVPLLVLAQASLASCAADGASGLLSGPPDALIEVTGSVPDVAACLRTAYAFDPFRFGVARDGAGVRITAFGAPSGRGGRRLRPRFSIGIGSARPGVVRVTLRTVWTLLGPDAEAERLRIRVARCGAGGAAGSISNHWPAPFAAVGRVPHVVRTTHLRAIPQPR